MRNLWLVAALVVACEAGEPHAPAIGTSSAPIVNGTREPQTVALTPEQVMAIGWLYSADAPSFPFCTGTLIAPDVVVTAAHCVWGSAAGEIGFGVGLDPDEPDGLFLSIGVFPNREVDAALILLGEDVTASGLSITPIPVNQVALGDSLVDRPVQAGGYGDTYDPDREGRWFATVYVAEVSDTEVVVDGRGDQGICFGDSGSGLIDLDAAEQPVVLAVESNGDASCVDIDHMTRLDPVWDWIAPVLEGVLPPDPCEGVGDEGRCDDDVALSCRRGMLRETNCSIWGAQCSYIDESARYGCPCGAVPEQGWCDGDVAESCREGRISQMNCATRGQRCGYVAEEDRYGCTGDPACLPEDEAGRCAGDTAIHCENDRTTRELCFVDGDVCLETETGASCEPAGGDADAGVDAGALPDAGTDAGATPDAGDDAPDAADLGGGGASGGGCGCRAAAPRPADRGVALFVGIVAAGCSLGRVVSRTRRRAGRS